MDTKSNTVSPIIFVLFISVVGILFSVQASSASEGKSGQYVDKSSIFEKYAEKGVNLGSREISLDVMDGWSVYPEILTSTQFMNEVVTKTLLISNTSDVTLTFNLASTDVLSNVLLMRLDEPSGATVFQDDSPEGNHGSCAGQKCPISGVDGKINTALSFDGIDDYLLVGNNDNSLSLVEMTVSAWIRSVTTNHGHIILYKNKLGDGTDRDKNYSLLITKSDIARFSFETNSGVNKEVFASSGVVDGEWHHIVGTYDGSSMRIYVDGTEEEMNNIGSFTPYQGPGPLQIGANELTSLSSPWYMDGEIDQVAIFNRALSAEEIQELYNSNWTGGSLVPWLLAEPITGTVKPNSSAVIVVAFDSTDLQPKVYNTSMKSRVSVK